MPTSPFGLGYGIGVAANAIPTQMNQRQNEALMTQMRGLQLQQMQRQEAQQEALQQAGQSVQPETETVETNPSPQLGMSAISPDVQESMKGLNLPVAGAIPNAPNASQVAAVQRPNQIVTRAKTYTTPYQQAAYRYGAMADYLFKQGQTEPAMRLQQQAMQASQMHQNAALQMAGRSILSGSYDSAIPYLKSVGMDVKSIQDDPNNPDDLIMTHPDGSESVVPRIAAGLVAADPSRGAEVMSMVNYRNAMMGVRQGALENQQNRTAAYQQHVQELSQHYKNMDARAQKAFGNDFAHLPVGQKNAILYVREHPEVTLRDAQDMFMRPANKQDSATMAQALHGLSLVNAGILKQYNNSMPDPKSPDPHEVDDYNTYMKNQAQMGILAQTMAEGKGKGKESATQPKTVTPSGLVGQTTSKPDGAYRLNGKTVTVKGGKIVSEE